MCRAVSGDRQRHRTRMKQGFSVFVMNWGDAGFKAVEAGRDAAGRSDDQSLTCSISTSSSGISSASRERTRRVAACIPAEPIEWTYKPGAFTLGDLVRHIAGDRKVDLGRDGPLAAFAICLARPRTR